MAGGSQMMWNLVWNTCRESQDHGPFNSVRGAACCACAARRRLQRSHVYPPFLLPQWGRVPYYFPWPNGTISPGIKPQYDELAFNFIVAGGGANGGAFDHDDGSSFYVDHDNFEVYGGHKSDFDVRSLPSSLPPRPSLVSLSLPSLAP